MLRTSSLRLCGADDLDAVLALLDEDPVVNAFLAARVRASGLEPWRLGGQVWGHVVDGRLDAVCYAGANLIPVRAGREAVAAFAERARRQGRRCSSLVGPAAQVLPLWELLEPHWGPAREVRPDQPLCVLEGPPTAPPDPLVRVVEPHETDLLVPACVAMYTEEVGVSPVGHDGGALYRARVEELVRAGRCFARIEDGRVLFKAEVGAVTPQACQVQGVWVDPSVRGRGLSVGGMAAVAELARTRLAPVVSLYVNSFNAPARAAYARVGFTQVGTFASVLF
ncbi:GNAT family N-acetyltransferase [Vallicoccus soli]|uniref:GNAT family N-acetyltransferase n=1 Tax=Vallicoccus soli TaxID=2339232 RepID=A0A3A3Z1M1_9ACTN|nr:GNAT family N-acetyltransferase [Vallicoccus soli]